MPGGSRRRRPALQQALDRLLAPAAPGALSVGGLVPDDVRLLAEELLRN